MKNQKGQTLLEVLLAVFIFTIGIVSLVSLAITSVTMSKQNSHELVATNLAREAIEVFRNKRDSQYLELEAANITDRSEIFDNSFFYTTSAMTGYLDFTSAISLNTTTGVWTVNYTPNSPSRVYLRSGYYTQTSTGATATPYYRLVYSYPICLNNSTSVERINTSATSTTLCTAAETQIGLDVRARIYWLEKGTAKNLYLEEKMYDWKY